MGDLIVWLCLSSYIHGLGMAPGRTGSGSVTAEAIYVEYSSLSVPPCHPSGYDEAIIAA
jgi:hypothetical protein